MSSPPTLNTPLRPPTTFITGHSPTGHAQIHTTRPATWTAYEGGQMGFNQIYTNPVPIDLNADKDLSYHDLKTGYNNPNPSSSKSTLGLAVKGGTVCRMVDFAPGYVCMMHRTQSLDFGIVLEGEVDLVLDDGSATRMGRGDIAVQRATMHSVSFCPKKGFFLLSLYFSFFLPVTFP